MKHLQEFYFMSLSNNDQVNKFERARLIKDYLDKNKMSARAFAVLFNIKRSTVDDWLLYNRIEESEYKERLHDGLKPIEIYKSLRENKNKKEIVFKTGLDRALDLCFRELSRYTRKRTQLVASHETVSRLHSLKDEVNRLDMKLERLRT